MHFGAAPCQETPNWFRSGFNFIDHGHVPSARVAGQTALGAERAKNVPHGMNAVHTFLMGGHGSADSWNNSILFPSLVVFCIFFWGYIQ